MATLEVKTREELYQFLRLGKAYVIVEEPSDSLNLVSGIYIEGVIHGSILSLYKGKLHESFQKDYSIDDYWGDADLHLTDDPDLEVDCFCKDKTSSTEILYFNRLTSATHLEALQVYRKRLEEYIKSISTAKE